MRRWCRVTIPALTIGLLLAPVWIIGLVPGGAQVPSSMIRPLAMGVIGLIVLTAIATRWFSTGSRADRLLAFTFALAGTMCLFVAVAWLIAIVVSVIILGTILSLLSD